MADTAIRVRAGETISIPFTGQTATDTYTAYVKDAVGRRMDATAVRSGTTVTVTVSASQWVDGRPGIGEMQLKHDDGTTVSYPESRQLRILPGIDAYGSEDGYSS